ncbi:MAG: hypothetical protein ABSA48_06930 [Terracidiphilus sp.]|jgi:hypothetical protein
MPGAPASHPVDEDLSTGTLGLIRRGGQSGMQVKCKAAEPSGPAASWSIRRLT